MWEKNSSINWPWYNVAMKKPQIKTKNKRYQKTEEAILDVLARSKELPTVGVLVRKARISRSTLYRHHRTVTGIVPDYEREVLIKYRGTMQRLFHQKNTQVRKICLRTLIFVMANRRIFEILLKYDGGAVIERMVLKSKKKLQSTYHLPKNPDKMLKVYTKEVVGIIEDWGRRGFCEDGMDMTLVKIMYLTDTMRQRLGPVNY